MDEGKQIKNTYYRILQWFFGLITIWAFGLFFSFMTLPDDDAFAKEYVKNLLVGLGLIGSTSFLSVEKNHLKI